MCDLRASSFIVFPCQVILLYFTDFISILLREVLISSETIVIVVKLHGLRDLVQ